VRKVDRRGNSEARSLAQQPRAQSGIGQKAQTQGHISAFGDQILGPVGHQQLDAQFRMLCRDLPRRAPKAASHQAAPRG
jgi:hypothetical protein